MANFDKKLVLKILGTLAVGAGTILSFIADKPDENEDETEGTEAKDNN